MERNLPAFVPRLKSPPAPFLVTVCMQMSSQHAASFASLLSSKSVAFDVLLPIGTQPGCTVRTSAY